MKFNIKLLIFIIFFALHNKDLYSHTLKESIELLYKNNQKLKSEQIKVLESKSNLLSTSLNALIPDVNYSESIKNEVTLTNGLDNSFTQTKPKQKQLSVSQNFSLAGTIISPINSKENLQYSKILLRINEQNILLEAITAYLAVIEKEEILRISNENFEISKKTSALIKKQFELGDTTKTQVEYAMSNVSSRESIKIKAEGALISARAAYKKIFGVDASNLSLPNNYKFNIPNEFNKYLKISLENNPILMSSKKIVDISKLNVAASTSALMPYMSFGYQDIKIDTSSIDDPADLMGTIKRQKSYSVSLNIPLIPKGGAEYTRILSSKLGYNKSLALHKYNIDEINERIISSWENLFISDANLKAAESAQNFAKNSMNYMTEEYELGTRSLLELLDTEKQYFESSINLILAKQQKILSYYSALSVLGKLDKNFI